MTAMKVRLLNSLFAIMSFCVRLYWRVMRPTRLGARCLVVDAQNKVLLVRHRGSGQWFLPGGGVKRNETLKMAAIRELREETGVILRGDDLHLLGCYTSTYGGKKDCIAVYKGAFHEEPPPFKPNLEIEEAQFFAFANLPLKTSPGTRRRLTAYFNKEQETGYW